MCPASKAKDGYQFTVGKKAHSEAFQVGQDWGEKMQTRARPGHGRDVPGSVVISAHLMASGHIDRLYPDNVSLQIKLDQLGGEIITDPAKLEPGMIVFFTRRREKFGPDKIVIVESSPSKGRDLAMFEEEGLVSCYHGKKADGAEYLKLVGTRPRMDYALKLGAPGHGERALINGAHIRLDLITGENGKGGEIEKLNKRVAALEKKVKAPAKKTPAKAPAKPKAKK